MTRAGGVYGEALFGLACEEKLEQQILDELTVLDESFRREPDFLRLLDHRSMPAEQRCTIVEESFRGRVHSYVLNFLKLLTRRGHILQFSDCVASYRELYYEANCILPVRAVTAVPLSQAQTQRLTDKLAAMTGRKILLTNRVEPAAIGGVRLEYAGQQVDDTVSRRLEELRSLLANTVL